MGSFLVVEVHGLVDEQAGLGQVVGEDKEEFVCEDAVDPFGQRVLDNDSSSLQLSGSYEVQLFDVDNFGGASLTLTANNSCLIGAGWNDRATSLKVRAAGAAFSRQLEAENANVNSGIVVEACSEGGQNMGFVNEGDYLVFNGINFPTSGSYLIEYRVASGAGGGTISSDLNAGTSQQQALSCKGQTRTRVSIPFSFPL